MSEEKPKILIDPNRMSRMCDQCGTKRGFYVFSCPKCGNLYNYLEIDPSDEERIISATERPERPHP